MPGEYINPTTIWTPQRGFDPGWAGGGPTTAFGMNAGGGYPSVMNPFGGPPTVASTTATPAGAPANLGIGLDYNLFNPQGAQATGVTPADNSFSIQRREEQYKAAGIPTDGRGNALPGYSAAAPQTWLPTTNPGPMVGANVTSTGIPPGAAAPAAPGQNPYSWLQNVTSANPLGQPSPTNPAQFATPESAAAIAALYGMSPWQLQLQGPGYGFSQPMQMFGPGVNAGLAATAFSNYGSTPGSYGRYLVDRDVYGLYGARNDPWANTGAPTGDWWQLSQGQGGGQNTRGQQTGGPYTAPTTTGGGSLTPGVPNIFLPPPGGGPGGSQPSGGWTGSVQPWFGGGGPPGAAQTPDQWLADYTNNTGYLSNIAANAGFPTDVGPAWQATIDAQQRNLLRNFANLQAGFAASGNRFSSDFGNAATDYWTQAGLNQSALLSQMSQAAQEAARGRELTAAGQLSGQGFTGASQLSSQAFQASQADYNRQLQAALAFMGAGSTSANLMAQLGAQGALGLQAGALQGAQGMFNTENSAAQQEIQRQLLLQQMGLGAAQTASQLWQSNLGLGGQLGLGQYGIGLGQNQAALQEWLRTQPQYNPLLAYIYGATTGFPPIYQPTWAPSNAGQLLGGIGGILGALPSLARLSDRRLKENIKFVGREKGFNIYEFNLIGFPNRWRGVMADEIQQVRPDAIFEDSGFLLVDYDKLGIEMRPV